jgi:hypothetical protein
MMNALAILLAAGVFQPSIPKTWSDPDVAALELPLANPKFSPVHISGDAYYRIPARIFYKSYPVYHPDREPAGYMEWLRTGTAPLLARLRMLVMSANRRF